MKHLILTLLAILSLTAVAQTKTDYDKALALHQKKAYPKALKAFTKEAQRDNLPAMYYAAYYHEKGMGVDTNYAAAITWYKRIISQQPSASSTFFTDSINQLAATMLPPGKTAADMVQHFKELAQDRPLQPEETYQYALCRQSLLNQDQDNASELQNILHLYTVAANQDHFPSTYRAATMLETTNPKQAAMYYRWICCDQLQAYSVPQPARITTQTMMQNTMARNVNGTPNQQRWSLVEQFEVQPNTQAGGITIINVTPDHISFQTLMNYLDGNRKPTNRFVVDRGETLTLLMTGVTDMRCELYVTYKK